MGRYKFTVTYDARIQGTHDVEVQGDSFKDAKEEAEETAKHEIDQTFSDAHLDCEIDSVDVTVTEVESDICECGGRKYQISVLEAGAGLLKVGPCPHCQLIPTTGDVCTHIIKILDKVAKEEEEDQE